MMRIQKKKILLFVGDILFIFFAFFISPPLKLGEFIWNFNATYWTLSTGYFILTVYLIIFFLADLYNVNSLPTDKRYLFRLFSAICIAAGIQTGFFFMIPELRSSRGIFVVNTGVVTLLSFFWRLIFEQLFKNVLRRKKNVLIIGGNPGGILLYKTIQDSPNYRPLPFMLGDSSIKKRSREIPKIIQKSNQLPEIVKSNFVQVIVIAEDKKITPSLTNSVLSCKLRGVEIYEMPEFYELLTGMIPVNHISHQWFISSQLSGVEKSIYNIRIKRVIDLTLSSIGLVVSSPVMLLVILLIKLSSPGPAIFRQSRIGLYGTPFFLYKFRTMTNNTGNKKTTAKDRENRITWIGKILRHTRFDEIPQMWNVLKGEMSFIGPRALMKEEVKIFESKVPYFPIRHSVRPGITGWAQVNYKHGPSLKDALEKIKYDLYYIKNLSLLLDMDILLKTIKVVLYGKGAS